MKIRDLKPTTTCITMANIPINTVFRGKIIVTETADEISSVFLKGYGAIMDLSDPENTWFLDKMTKCVLHDIVTNYQPVKAELIINYPLGGIINTEEEAQIYAKDIIT